MINAGVGCECESIDQGKSFIDEILIFLSVSSQNILNTME